MGTKSEHQKKATSHLAFLETIPDEFPDWLCTAAFYAAVELIELILADHQRHSKSHFDRKEALKKHFPNRQLNQAYFDLYNASLDARYLPSDQCPTADEARRILIGQRLAFIRSYVEARIEKPAS